MRKMPGQRSGSVLVGVIIITLLLLTIGTTMLSVSSRDSGSLNPDGKSEEAVTTAPIELVNFKIDAPSGDSDYVGTYTVTLTKKDTSVAGSLYWSKLIGTEWSDWTDYSAGKPTVDATNNKLRGCVWVDNGPIGTTEKSFTIAAKPQAPTASPASGSIPQNTGITVTCATYASVLYAAAGYSQITQQNPTDSGVNPVGSNETSFFPSTIGTFYIRAWGMKNNVYSEAANFTYTITQSTNNYPPAEAAVIEAANQLFASVWDDGEQYVWWSWLGEQPGNHQDQIAHVYSQNEGAGTIHIIFWVGVYEVEKLLGLI